MNDIFVSLRILSMLTAGLLLLFVVVTVVDVILLHVFVAVAKCRCICLKFNKYHQRICLECVQTCHCHRTHTHKH